MRDFYTVEDVKEILSVKQSKAYSIIKNLNEELKKKGFLVQAGRVNITYFRERYKLPALTENNL